MRRQEKEEGGGFIWLDLDSNWLGCGGCWVVVLWEDGGRLEPRVREFWVLGSGFFSLFLSFFLFLLMKDWNDDYCERVLRLSRCWRKLGFVVLGVVRELSRGAGVRLCGVCWITFDAVSVGLAELRERSRLRICRCRFM